MHNGGGHILVDSHWAAYWGRVDDKIIDERKAIQDSVRQQVNAIDNRIKYLESFTPSECFERFIGWTVIVATFIAPIYLASRTSRDQSLSNLTVAVGVIAVVSGGAKLLGSTRTRKQGETH